ncbi:hypothetical protein L1049_016685 [Liquidambar formosana]|uniref:S-protein homolog n=1 Tax=Liquidambar formosana TaxID=63359 RepID=A0AAP0X390_LIQFO
MGLFNTHLKLALAVLVIALLEAPIIFAKTQDDLGEDIVIGLVPVTISVSNLLTEEIWGLNFTIHCKSKEDDIGIHEIPFLKRYEWKFRVNFWGTTLFFCSVKWRDGEGTWDLFEAKRDMSRCYSHCSWIARKDGLYGYTDTGETDIIFKWSKPPN